VTTGVLNYPRRPLSERERTIREALSRFASSSTTAAGALTVVHTTADQTFNSSTVANVTDLSFIVANGTYSHFRFFLIVRNSSVTEGAKFTLTLPAVTRFAARAFAILGNNGAVTTWEDTILSSGDVVVTVNFPVVNTDYPIIIEGAIVPAADGSVQLQAGNESGIGTVTVRQGSCGILTGL